MQIKTTMRYHLTLVRMAIIKKTKDVVIAVSYSYCGEYFTIYTHIELCRTPETNIMLYTNYISIFKMKGKKRQEITSAGKMWRKGNPCALLVGM